MEGVADLLSLAAAKCYTVSQSNVAINYWPDLFLVEVLHLCNNLWNFLSIYFTELNDFDKHVKFDGFSHVDCAIGQLSEIITSGFVSIDS